ncbi:MAG: hypothetical protein GDA56_26235 [Hormoscilla sp. GM7CHS1pb]|nr:hypothetical protein [Hormoscilla sp. GM7CHS1pb]
MESTVMDQVAFQIGSSGVGEEVKDIAIDRNGDVWITGEFRDSIDLDGDGEHDLISNGSFDSYVVKFDSEGKLVRAYDFGNTEILLPDKGIGIATDSNDNAWVLGGFHGSIDIDGDGKDDLTSSDSYGSHYLAKFNSEGDFVQALEIGDNYTDHTESGKSIAIDSKDNVWTKGSFWRHLDIDGDGEDDLTNNGGRRDSYFAKFDSEGDLVNVFQIGGSGDDVGDGIAIDKDDHVWTTGSFTGSIDIDEDGEDDLTSNGSDDGYVAKFDSEGALLFAKNIGGSDYDYSLDIATDSNGDAWVLGVFQGNIDIDGDGTNDLTDGSKDYPWATDEYLAKFDSNGDFVKALKLGHHGSIDIDNDDILVPHIASSIAIDSDDNLWVTGSFHESMDLDGDGENDLTSNGEHDSYVAKFSSNVDLVQAYNIGGSDSDYGDVIAADSNGNVWAAGSFRDSIDINGDGSNDLTPNGVENIYVVQVQKATTEEVTQLKVTPSESTKAVEPNTSVSFDVNYSTEPAETPTTGIVFQMHWDSSQVAFDPVTGLTEHFPLGAQPISAVLDDPITNGGLDGDPSTDKYILQAWVDANGNWPNSPNPTLYTANFTALPGFSGTQINFGANSDDLPANSNFVPSSIALTSPAPSPAPSPALDIDGNGVIDALTDGLVAIRYLFGFRGETLTEGVVSEGATRDTSEIVTYLDEMGDTMLDVDGNGTAGALTDGILFMRHALGFSDQALISGAVSEDATRTTASAINEHLQSFGMM